MSNDKGKLYSYELSRADLTQTTYLHMAEREREREREIVMMTKQGNFPSIKHFVIT